MKSPTDVVSGFILLGLCGVGAYSVATLPDAGGMEHVGPGAFPAGILAFIGLFYLYLVTLTGLGELFLNMENPPFQANGAFSISTFLFLLIALPLLGRRKPIEILSVAVLTTAVLVFAFGWFFQVLLP